MDLTTVVFSMLMACSYQNGKADCPPGLNPGDTRTINFGVYHDGGERNIVEISNNDKLVFVMHENGSVTKTDDFIPDQYAYAFWKSMQENYKICEFETRQQELKLIQPKNRFRPKRMK